MTDPTKYPLKFPKSFIPYLEKHRIIELFHEIARELVIHKPADHILFMKQILETAADSRDVSKVILISSQKINRILLAKAIAKLTQQIVITSNDLENLYGGDLSEPDNSQDIAKGLVYLIKTQTAASKYGWIIADCVNNEDFAKNLLRYGVLPTHVFLIILPFEPKLTEFIYCNVSEYWPKTRHNLFALKQLFYSKLHEIHVSTKTIEAITQECVDLCKIRKPIKLIRPRVVILGPRGCGRRTQAAILNKSLGLVHIKFEYILCQAWTSENELGKKLRQCGNNVCLHSELLCQIVNKRILEDDCIDNGWVLTGYPYTETDFKFLDCLETSPNRVVIIDCDLNICKERIQSRDFSVSTSQEDPLNTTLSTHPNDLPEVIDAEHQYYCENYNNIKRYVDKTAIVVNGNQNEKWIHECIVAYIMGANPTGPPRKAFGKQIPEISQCESIKISKDFANIGH